MDFGGDLSILEPSIVFQIMSMAGSTGQLKFVSPENVASFCFKGGELIHATIDTRRKKLGEFLVERGWITQDQFSRALAEYLPSRAPGRIGNHLISRKYLTRDTLVMAIQEQMKEVVYEVLAWKQGQFVFMNGVLPHDEDILLEVKLDHLILEGLKRIDEADA
jgi:hypothetical protein